MGKIKKVFCSSKNLGRDGVIIFLVSLTAISFVRAGNLDSPGAPTATMFTLNEIYARLTTNGTAIEGSHLFAPVADPASSLRTLKEIYEAIPTIDPLKIKQNESYLGISGTLTPDGGTASAADLFSGKTANLTNDWTLDTGTLSLACATATFDGTGNLVADAYDGAGSGGNRWCITNSGDAVAGDILTGKTAWSDGVAISGSMADIGQENFTPGTLSQTISEGYHDGTGVVSGDSDLVVGNIKSGTTIFGVTGTLAAYTYGDNDASKVAGTATAPGTLLLNEKNGTAGASVADYAFYTQALGGVDDYNNGGAMPAGTYSGTWTACNSDNSYCSTSDATNADKKDDSTGVVWSKWLDSGTTHTWFWANNCYEPGTAENPGTCVNNGDDACRCIKKPAGVKVGCEAVGDGNWRLPFQKELMQAYIDGSWGNLSSPGTTYWSATTGSSSTHTAWLVYLSIGTTATNTKSTSASYRVRCVR